MRIHSVVVFKNYKKLLDGCQKKLDNTQMSGVFIVSASRTVFGNFCGKLKNISATDLAVIASQSAIAHFGKSASIDSIDNVVFGNVLQTSSDAAYLARHVGLRSSVPFSVPAVTVNRLCGSGFEAVATGAMNILCGRSQAALVGGTESMSQAPFVLRGIRDGIKFSFKKGPELEDTLATSLYDTVPNQRMGDTAENIAKKHAISRKECDEFAVRSHKLAKKGIFQLYLRNILSSLFISFGRRTFQGRTSKGSL